MFIPIPNETGKCKKKDQKKIAKTFSRGLLNVLQTNIMHRVLRIFLGKDIFILSFKYIHKYTKTLKHRKNLPSKPILPLYSDHNFMTAHFALSTTMLLYHLSFTHNTSLYFIIQTVKEIR